MKKNAFPSWAIPVLVVIIIAVAMTMVALVAQRRRSETFRAPRGPRIVGGWQAGSYPSWMVHLGNCGGSLISPTFVLTAKHCNAVVNGTVRIGNVEERLIAQVIPHENPFVDLTLLKLNEPSTQTPIVMYKKRVGKDRVLKAIGHGVTQSYNFYKVKFGMEPYPSSSHHVLMETIMNAAPMKECSRSFIQANRRRRGNMNAKEIEEIKNFCKANYSRYSPDMQGECDALGTKNREDIVRDVKTLINFEKGLKTMCVTSPYGGVCNGDSGGPLFISDWEGPFLVGVAKAGNSGCPNNAYDGKYMALFTPIRAYRDWIRFFAGV